MTKYLAVAITTVALSLALVGCGSSNKSSTKTSTSTSTSTSTTTISSGTSTAPAAGAKYTIADYIRDSHITGDPRPSRRSRLPTINLPLPAGWKVSDSINTSYGGIVLDQPANPSDPPSISALVSKLTGDVDPAKIIQYAPGELQNLPGYQGTGDGTASTLSGFQAWQLNGACQKDGKTRAVAQKTVVIPAQGAVFALQLNADSLESDQGPLMDATNVIDDQTTITT